MSPQERGRILFRIAQTLRAHADQFAETESRNSGKPIVEAESDIEDTATCFEYYGGMATKIQGDVVPAADDALVFVAGALGARPRRHPWERALR